jgi:glycerophosphoryl diester phosphodiesterase
LVIGHRGAPEQELENTLASFKQAIKIGADGFELDVQETKDGVLVIYHDYDLSRLSCSDALIGETTYDDIQSVKLQGGETIPTLDEVLDFAQGRAVVDIEIKGLDIEEKVLHSVKSHDMLNDVQFSSFYHVVLQRIRELEPEAETGVLYSSPLDDPISYALKLEANAINPLVDLFDPELVVQAHKNGLRVFPWTVNDADTAAEFAKLDVDAIITDVPGTCLSVYKRMNL